MAVLEAASVSEPQVSPAVSDQPPSPKSEPPPPAPAPPSSQSSADLSFLDTAHSLFGLAATNSGPHSSAVLSVHPLVIALPPKSGSADFPPTASADTPSLTPADLALAKPDRSAAAFARSASPARPDGSADLLLLWLVLGDSEDIHCP